MAESPQKTAISRDRPLWRNGSFTLMWTSVAASGFGDRMIQLGAFALLGVGISGDAASLTAAVYFFFLLPYVFISPLGGWLADTLPRKWLMWTCDQGRGLLLLWAALLVPASLAAAIPGDHQWKLFAMLFAVGSFAAIFSPTRNATVPGIVPLSQLQSANAIILGITTIASLLGMGIGGWLIDETNPGSVKQGIFIGAALYLVSGWFFPFMRVRQHFEKQATTPAREIGRMVTAWQYIRRHRRVLELVLLNVLFWGAANLLIAANSALANNRFYVEGGVVGRIAVMGLMLGVGMMLSALFLAWVNTFREANWTMMLACVCCGVCIVLLAICPSYPVALVLCLLIGFFGNVMLISTSTLVQAITPDYLRGRVFGIRDMLNTLSSVVVNLVIWRMPNADGWMIPAMAATGGILFVVGMLYGYREMTAGPMPTRALNAINRVACLYALVWHRVRWSGRHYVPRTGPVILASNHTTGVDPFLLQTPLPRLIRWVMLTSYQFSPFNFVWKRIQPIALDLNSSDLTKIRQIVATLKEDQIVGLFPEGALQREVRELKPLQPGIAMIARRGGAVIVPAWIDGTPLKRSMTAHFLCPSRSSVRFGPPFRPERNMSDEQVLEELRKRLLALRPG